MNTEKLIVIDKLCKYYHVERSFFSELNDFGLVEILIIEDVHFIHEEKIDVVDKVIRLQKDLNLNMEGIDTVFNLLRKIDELEKELNDVKNRLRVYEG